MGTSEGSEPAPPERRPVDHLRLALDASGLGTWRWDLASGATWWDEQLEELHGLEPGGFDGRFETYVGFLHPDDREDVLAAVRDAVANKRAYRVEHRVVRPDGSVRWIAGAGSVTLDEHGEVTGTIGCAGDVTARREEQHERQRLAAVAVEAAERDRVQRERLEFMATINEELNASGSVDDILVRVTRATVPRLGDWCAVHLVEGEGPPRVEIAHVDPAMVAYARDLGERFPYDPDALVGVPNVIRTGATEFFPHIDEGLLREFDATDEARAVIEQLALRSSITVALRKRDRVLGAMQFVMSSSSRAYTHDDVALAEAVAGRIAASLENRRLAEQHLRIAQTLQRSLLPASLPDIPGVDFAVRYWAAGEGAEVGGDFYDVFTVADERWAVVIGDVCGTGPAAAALTGLARHSIRDAAWHGDGPAEVLRSLHRAIHRSDVQSFCTAAYATLAWDGDRLRGHLAVGGHPLPVLVRDGTPHPVGRPGSLLGMLREVRCEEVELDLVSGDVLVLFTDGATDLRPPHDLTPEAMAGLLADAVGPTAEATAESIHDHLETRVPFKDRNDDLALLVLRVR